MSEDEISDSIRALAAAVTPPGSCGADDAAGTYCESLTEAVMGVTAGLVKIADALEMIGDEMREARESAERLA